MLHLSTRRFCSDSRDQLIIRFYSIAMLYALAKGRQPIEPATAHLIDLSVTSALLLMTQGLFGPFAFFFNFILLAASLRWSWRGGCADGGISVLLGPWINGD